MGMTDEREVCFMDLDELKRKSVIHDKKSADEIRKRYIETFVNTEKSSYHDQIEKLQKFTDGYCYVGYLWDFLREPEMVEESLIYSYRDKMKSIYVFWDIHSSEKIWIKDYWKFDKDAVLRMSMDTLLAGCEFLPEDIYICDSTFQLTFVMTHEEIENKRYCLKCGEFMLF